MTSTEAPQSRSWTIYSASPHFSTNILESWHLSLSSLSSKHVHLISEKRKTEERDFGFAAHIWSKSQKMKRRDLGKEGNACRQTPGFWKPLLASEWSTWLEQLVKNIDMCQSKVCFILKGHNRHINFLQLLFILVSKICPLIRKSIFFDLFWNVKHFLRLNKSNKGFRLFNLFSKVPPVSETLKTIFFVRNGFLQCFVMLGPAGSLVIFAGC